MTNQLVTTEWLAEHLNDPDIVIADVRWVHKNPAAAFESYLSGHIPSAVFVDTDADLSEVGDYSKGRHPLPTPEQLVARLARKGIGQGKRVVCTEGESFKIAARLWWLLRWVGVDDVAVLDGGFTKWEAEGRAVETVESKSPPVKPYAIHLRPELMADARQVALSIGKGGSVLDARTSERFRGEIEPLDKRAGHIHGAGNLPLTELVEGTPPRLKSVASLRKEIDRLGLNTQQPVTAYCGSGVTACQILWALDQAGFTELKLYPGSWSEWIELHPDSGVVLT